MGCFRKPGYCWVNTTYGMVSAVMAAMERCQSVTTEPPPRTPLCAAAFGQPIMNVAVLPVVIAVPPVAPVSDKRYAELSNGHLTAEERLSGPVEAREVMVEIGRASGRERV